MATIRLRQWGAAANNDHVPAPRSRRIGRTLVLVGVAVVAVLVHLGLFGGALAALPWTSWGANVVLALILLKLVTVAAHVVLGRVGFRHLKSIRHRRRARTELSAVAESPARRHAHPS